MKEYDPKQELMDSMVEIAALAKVAAEALQTMASDPDVSPEELDEALADCRSIGEALLGVQEEITTLGQKQRNNLN